MKFANLAAIRSLVRQQAGAVMAPKVLRAILEQYDAGQLAAADALEAVRALLCSMTGLPAMKTSATLRRGGRAVKTSLPSPSGGGPPAENGGQTTMRGERYSPCAGKCRHEWCLGYNAGYLDAQADGQRS